MTASGTGNTVPSSQPSGSEAPHPAPVKDLIPVPLLAGIFAVIMVFTWWIQGQNWVTDMTRYRSLRAQKNGDYQTAVDLLQKLREAGKGTKDGTYFEFSPTYLSELGSSYFHLGQLDKSLEYYNLAQQYRANMTPDDSGNARPPIDFNNSIGFVLYNKGDLDNAEKAELEALKFNKLDPLANFVLGEIAMKRGDYKKAADYFKVVAKNPQYQKRVQEYYEEIEKKLFAGIK